MALGSMGIQEYLRSILGSGQLPVETQEGRGDMDAEGNVLGVDEEDVLERLGPRAGIQDFIMQQLAGDVVRLPLAPNATMEDARRRGELRSGMRSTGTRGQQSIEELGGRKNPYLDLMDVIMYPQGGKIY